MSLTNLAYRGAKSVLGRTPPWLLRVRPYTVYSIRTERFLEAGTLAEGPRPETIRWVASAEEAASLDGLAAEENYSQWDGTTRRAAVALDGQQPVACVWVAGQDYVEQELALRMLIEPGDRWGYAGVVRPEYRGTRVYGRLLRFLGREIHREGAGRLLYGVVHGNQLSLRAHARFQPAALGRIMAARSLGVSICHTWGAIEHDGSWPVACRKPLALRVRAATS